MIVQKDAVPLRHPMLPHVVHMGRHAVARTNASAQFAAERFVRTGVLPGHQGRDRISGSLHVQDAVHLSGKTDGLHMRAGARDGIHQSGNALLDADRVLLVPVR